MFNLEQLKRFCDQHRVEVLMMEDTLYHCYIGFKADGGNYDYATGLTFFDALETGINTYLSFHN